MGIIYSCTNLINNKIYIGKTSTDFEKYKKKHIQAALRNDDQNKKYFYRAIRKHGSSNFVWRILEECSDSKLNIREIYHIELMGVRNRDIGYNIAKGGFGGDTMSMHPNKKEIYEKSKKNMCIAQQKIRKTKEWGENISKGLKKLYKEHPEKQTTLKLKLFLRKD